ncbi:PilX N-terminal domain-containing pilus assembly protein [Marinobacter pelagius]|uniref:pilus assembly PilX family protein n=1 Tax=Marinobacter sp. C7 TaxID=2951363 RepID=UPI001EF036B5|nr:PilX N-terminal domain-containing pilus assembly protein [Marinobacter sp. C7]
MTPNMRHQSGAVLLTSLLILLVLTLLALSGMQGAQLQERMTSAVREGQVALEAAEFAVREGEQYLEDQTVTLGNFGTSGGLYTRSDAPDPMDDSTWDSNASNSIAVSGFPGTLAEQPRFFVEYIGITSSQESPGDLQITNYDDFTGGSKPLGFRIVGWSSGRSGETRRIVEAYYGTAK